MKIGGNTTYITSFCSQESRLFKKKLNKHGSVLKTYVIGGE